ncbi:MAG: hypothetical protein AAB740_05080 [Patescibacteria group bacterium]
MKVIKKEYLIFQPFTNDEEEKEVLEPSHVIPLKYDQTKKQLWQIDRGKIRKNWDIVKEIYYDYFVSNPFCNRCNKIVFNLGELELAHGDYSPFNRSAELLCRPCHEKVDWKEIKSPILISERKIKLNDILKTKLNDYPEFVVFYFITGSPLVILMIIKDKTARWVFFGNPPKNTMFPFTIAKGINTGTSFNSV